MISTMRIPQSLCTLTTKQKTSPTSVGKPTGSGRRRLLRWLDRPNRAPVEYSELGTLRREHIPNLPIGSVTRRRPADCPECESPRVRLRNLANSHHPRRPHRRTRLETIQSSRRNHERSLNRHRHPLHLRPEPHGEGTRIHRSRLRRRSPWTN